MRRQFLQFAPPLIGDDEVAEVVRCLRSGWITTGPVANRFEQAFAEYVGAERALALNSGTAALHCGLAALGVRESDAVVIPTMTFSSAAHTVEHIGARPVFVDAEPDGLNPDPDGVERATANERARFILAVHLYGRPCDERLFELGVPVVDDAAHALPARTEDGVLVGGSGRASVLTAFSFYATKNLTTGEGGMLTGPEDLVEQARSWSLHGMTADARHRYEAGSSWRYDVTRAGFKYNMADINASLGLVQLRRLPAMHARRKEIALRYGAELEHVDAVQCPAVQASGHAWHIYAIRLHLDRLTLDRDGFIGELSKRNIATSVHFIPIHLLTYYRDKYRLRPEDFPVATREFSRLVSLPIYPAMTDADVDDVVEAVADVCAKHRR
jgi:dTDP-4-amino-4,6-dideoxygalactose transaminase